ncbi:MAG: hypothetical protein WDN28_23555 [Chthoniobacter sp.]
MDKNGLIGGAYKNVMTGDEQPIVGQLDRKTQRIAWHVGNATQTVYETGFSSLQNDVLSVFVHFGEAQTQTWLLVTCLAGNAARAREVTRLEKRVTPGRFVGAHVILRDDVRAVA